MTSAHFQKIVLVFQEHFELGGVPGLDLQISRTKTELWFSEVPKHLKEKCRAEYPCNSSWLVKTTGQVPSCKQALSSDNCAGHSCVMLKCWPKRRYVFTWSGQNFYIFL